MSLKITGKTKIFKNEKGLYCTTISTKKEDGSYENMRISVNFRKGIELENKTDIEIKDGFLSFWKNKDNQFQLKLVILDFDNLTSITNENENIVDDLPF